MIEPEWKRIADQAYEFRYGRIFRFHVWFNERDQWCATMLVNSVTAITVQECDSEEHAKALWSSLLATWLTQEIVTLYNIVGEVDLLEVIDEEE